MKTWILVASFIVGFGAFAQNITIDTDRSNETISGGNITVSGNVTITNVNFIVGNNFKVLGDAIFINSFIEVDNNAIFSDSVTFQGTCVEVDGNLVGGGSLTTDNDSEDCLDIDGNIDISVNDQTLGVNEYVYVRDLPVNLPYVIFNMSGQKVLSGKTGTNDYKNAGLAQGMYIFNVYTYEVQFSKKIIL